jgi:hypothetical protein
LSFALGGSILFDFPTAIRITLPAGEGQRCGSSFTPYDLYSADGLLCAASCEQFGWGGEQGADLFV